MYGDANLLTGAPFLNLCARLTILRRTKQNCDTLLLGILKSPSNTKPRLIKAAVLDEDSVIEEKNFSQQGLRSSELRSPAQHKHPQQQASHRSTSREHSLGPGGSTKRRPEQRSPGKRSDPRDPRKIINGKIIAAGTAEELISVVERHIQSPDFNLVNAVTALHRISKYVSQPVVSPAKRRKISSNPTVIRLAAGAEDRIGEMDGYGLSNVAWACRNLELGSADFLAKVQARFLDKLPTMRDREVCGTLAAFCKCGHLTKENLEVITPHWLKWLQSQRRVSTRCLNGVIWAYVKADLAPSDYDQRLIAELARLGKRPTKNPTRMDMASLVWAFARLEVKDQVLFDILAYNSCQVLEAEGKPEPSFQEAQDLCNLAWGFGKAFAHIASRPGHDRRIDAYITFHMQAKPVREKVFKIISERLPRVQGYLDPVGYSSLICGFANARFYDEPIMQLLTENMSAVGNVFSIQAASVTLWAYSVLKYDAPDLFEVLAARVLDLLPHEDISGQAVTMILISCAAMDLTRLPTCDRLVMALTQVVDKDVGVLKTMQSLVNVAWSLACLDRIDTPLLDKICHRAYQHGIPSAVGILNQIYMADLTAQHRQLRQGGVYSPPQSHENGDLTEEQREADEIKEHARRAWFKQVEKDTRNITGLHWNVANVLKQIGGRFMLEYNAEGFSLDIAIKEHKIAVEVDGPCHFTRNTNRQLGYSLLKHRILAQSGWQIVVVEHFKWNPMNHKEKAAHLKSLLESAGWKQPVQGNPFAYSPSDS